MFEEGSAIERSGEGAKACEAQVFSIGNQSSIEKDFGRYLSRFWTLEIKAAYGEANRKQEGSNEERKKSLGVWRERGEREREGSEKNCEETQERK